MFKLFFRTLIKINPITLIIYQIVFVYFSYSSTDFGNNLNSLYIKGVTQNSATLSFVILNSGNCEVVFGVMESYGHMMPCGKGDNQVILKNLEPGKKYYYNVKHKNELQFQNSGDYFFNTLIPDPKKSIVFAVIGDTRSGEESFHTTHIQVIESIQKHTFPIFLLHLGDMVNPMVKNPWETFFKIESPLLKNSPIFPVRGNSDGSLEEFNKLFSFPGKTGWSSVGNGPVFIIALDVQFKKPASYYLAQIGPESEQYRWLENTLDSDQRLKKPFTIVTMVSPVFTPDNSAHPQVAEILTPLFEEKQVDLVLGGSVHYFSYANKNGVEYVISGGGGAVLERPKKNNQTEVKYFHSQFHHLRVSANYPALTIEAVGNTGNVFFTKDIITQDKKTSGRILKSTNPNDFIVYGSLECSDCQNLKENILPKLIEALGLKNSKINFKNIDEEKNYLEYVDLESRYGTRKHSFPVVLHQMELMSGYDLENNILHNKIRTKNLKQKVEPKNHRMIVVVVLLVVLIFILSWIYVKNKK